MKKYIIKKIDLFFDWVIKKFGSDIEKYNEIIEIRNIVNKKLKK